MAREVLALCTDLSLEPRDPSLRVKPSPALEREAPDGWGRGERAAWLLSSNSYLVTGTGILVLKTLNEEGVCLGPPRPILRGQVSSFLCFLSSPVQRGCEAVHQNTCTIPKLD